MKIGKRIAAFILTLVFACCLLPAAMADSDYTDVQHDLWCADAVMYCRENGLMLGTSATTFSPNVPVDRAMFVTVLYRISGQPIVGAKSPFTDVPENSYCAKAIAWAANQGVALGYEDSSFKPQQAINREQMACMLARFIKLVDAPFIYGPEAELMYTDGGLISAYARDSVDLIRKTGLMRGFSDGAFRPQSIATRAEAAMLFSRFHSALEAEPPASLAVYGQEGQSAPHVYILTKADADSLYKYLNTMEKTEKLHAEFVPTHVLKINGNEYSFEITDGGNAPSCCNYRLGSGEYGLLSDVSGTAMSEVITVISNYQQP